MELADSAQQMFEAGQRRWPGVRLEFARFQARCEQLFGEAARNEPVQFGAELYLCCACAEGDAEAQRAFERELGDVAKLAIARIHPEPEFSRDVLQELWEKLLVGPKPKVRDYGGRGPLSAWVRVAAARLALDRCRADKVARATKSELSDELASQTLGPEFDLTRARFADSFREALRHAVAALSRQERSVLRMHVLGRCSIDQIGRAYQVHRATAARWLEQARVRIYDHTRHTFSVQNARMTDSEFKSLARALGSELDFSFLRGSVELPSEPGRPSASATGE